MGSVNSAAATVPPSEHLPMGAAEFRFLNLGNLPKLAEISQQHSRCFSLAAVSETSITFKPTFCEEFEPLVLLLQHACHVFIRCPTRIVRSSRNYQGLRTFQISCLKCGSQVM